MKLLLHTCCGPCFLGVWEELGSQKDIVTTLYYDNDNIYPETEWEKRRDNLRVVAKDKNVLLIEAGYEPEHYQGIILNAMKYPDIPEPPDSSATPQNDERKMDSWLATRNDNEKVLSQEIRCPICYRYRLEKTAKYAKENGFDAISTTLFVSPYQRHEELRKVAQEVCNDYGLDFYYTDWRPYFREGQNEARELGIYRQKYCGCRYSLAESRR